MTHLPWIQRAGAHRRYRG